MKDVETATSAVREHPLPSDPAADEFDLAPAEPDWDDRAPGPLDGVRTTLWCSDICRDWLQNVSHERYGRVVRID
jgi:hypothetical protein